MHKKLNIVSSLPLDFPLCLSVNGKIITGKVIFWYSKIYEYSTLPSLEILENTIISLLENYVQADKDIIEGGVFIQRDFNPCKNEWIGKYNIYITKYVIFRFYNNEFKEKFSTIPTVLELKPAFIFFRDLNNKPILIRYEKVQKKETKTLITDNPEI